MICLGLPQTAAFNTDKTHVSIFWDFVLINIKSLELWIRTSVTIAKKFFPQSHGYELIKMYMLTISGDIFKSLQL